MRFSTLRMVTKLAVGVAILLCASAEAARGSTISYSSRAAFLAASSGVTTIDFNGIAAPGSFVFYGAGPLVLAGVTITSNNQMFVIDPAFYGFSYAGGGFLNSDYVPLNILTFTLPSARTAVGFDFGGLFGAPVTFTVSLGNGDVFTPTSTGSTAAGSLGFAGYVSTVPFTSFTLTMPDTPNYNAVDNVSFGAAASAVPEPASLTLLLTGVAGLTARRFRRRHQL